MNGKGLGRVTPGSPTASQPIVIIQTMKEISHGVRTQSRGTHRPPRRRRHRQPPRLRRARREPVGRDRRVLPQQADGRAGRQDRVAPHRHLPGRAHHDVREARPEGPAGLHRRQAPDAPLVEARRGRRPVLDRDPARPRRTRPVPRPAQRRGNGAAMADGQEPANGSAMPAGGTPAPSDLDDEIPF